MAHATTGTAPSATAPAQARGRILALDLARSVAMLYIIGFVHLMNYTTAFPGYANPFTQLWTYILLGLFVMVSGYLIGKGHLRRPRTATAFLRSKITRIYIPFLVACVMFLGLYPEDAAALIKSVAALSMLWNPAPKTLWFVVMILNFYLAAPLLVPLAGSPARFAAACAGLAGCVWVLHLATGSVDGRLYIYFPSFCVGMLLSHHAREDLRPSPRALKACLAAFAVLCVPYFAAAPFFALPAVAALGAYLVLVACFAVRLPRAAVAPVQAFAYASYCMYLLHRGVYGVSKRFLMPADPGGQMLFLFLAALPAVFVLSYAVQKTYDLLLARLRATR